MDLPRHISLHRGKLRIDFVHKKTRYRQATDFRATKSGIEAAIKQRDALYERVRFGSKPVDSEVRENLFYDAAGKFLQKQKTLGRQNSTLEGYQGSLNKFWHPLNGRLIQHITRNDLIDLDESIEWSNSRTHKNALTALRGVFRYAMSRGWIADDPTTALKNPKVEATDPDPYTQDEVARLLQVTDQGRFADYFRLAFGTGARTGELLALTWADWNGESLWINKSVVRNKLQQRTKTGKPRRVVLSRDLTRHLQGMARPINGGSIVSITGETITNAKPIVAAFREAHDNAQVRWRTGPYPWRHTYISSMLSIGVDPFLVASNVGDRVDTILTYYAKYLPIRNEVEIMHDAWDRLEKR